MTGTKPSRVVAENLPTKRAAATEKRRRDILDAALSCFVEFGVTRATLEDIRSRAGASTGSIYHHFSSKEQLAGALYLEGVREVQDLGLATLIRHRSAERGIRAVVRGYLEWIRENPDLALFLFDHRHAEFVVRAEPVLDELNAGLRAKLADWLRRHIDAGVLPEMSAEMYWAVMIGPSDFVSRRALCDDRMRDLSSLTPQLEDAAWGALMGILGRDG